MNKLFTLAITFILFFAEYVVHAHEHYNPIIDDAYDLISNNGPQSLSDSLVSYWKFDGDVTDGIGSNDGTIIGAGSSYVSGKHGQGINLDGMDTYVNAGDDATLDFTGKSLTISAWFKVTEFDKFFQTLISKGEGSNFRIARLLRTDSLSYSEGSGDIVSNVDVNDGGIHHVVAVTHAGISTSLYIDGVLTVQNMSNANIADGGMPLFIGNNPEQTGRSWHGIIDDLALWSRPLSSSEISDIYTAGVSLEDLIILNFNNTCTKALPACFVTDFGSGCSSPTILPFTTDGTTSSGQESMSCPAGSDQWFSWTATTTKLNWSPQDGEVGISIWSDCQTFLDCRTPFSNDNTPLDGWAIDDELLIQIYEAPTTVNTDVSFCLQDACGSAGTGINLSTCSTVSQPVDLHSLLTGEDPGGTWSETSAVPSTGIAFDATAATFIPDGQLDGVYEFTYDAPGDCASTMVTVTLSSTISTIDLAAHLVSYWDFDDNTDDHRSGNHGTIVGSGYTYEDGVHGKGIDLDGVDTYVNVNHDPSLDFTDKSLTIAAWFRVDDFNKSWQALISKGENRNFRIARSSNTDSLAYNGGTLDIVAPIDINDGEFHHIVSVTKAGVSKSIYIDGQLAIIAPIGNDIADTGLDLFIGNNPVRTARSWNGMIDDMAIWDKALDACEVGFIYQGAESIREKFLPCTDLSFYVNAGASPGGDGLSWATAFDDLQDALDLACFCGEGDSVPEIHVMEGAYYPSREFDADESGGSDPREATYYINKNIQLYGGYYLSSNQVLRNWKTHPTILSGDIGVKDDVSDNSYHVMQIDGGTSTGVIDNSCIIDGLFVQDGRADGSFPNFFGGAIRNIVNTLSAEVSPIIRNCNFNNNYAFSSGGAVYGNGFRGITSPTYENCIFEYNVALGEGGAMRNIAQNGGQSSPKIINSRFRNNSAQVGGAISNVAGNAESLTVITNCLFQKNTADIGGAIYNDGPFNNTVMANSSPHISNSTFANNTTISNSSGAIHTVGIDNGTSDFAHPVINNSIFWNKGREIYNDEDAVTTITNCLIKDVAADGSIDAIAGTTFMGTNLDAYPMFQDSMNGDFSLMDESPAIDAGDSSLVQSVYDITDDTPRIMNQVDMGAYEHGNKCNRTLRFYLPGVFNSKIETFDTSEDIEISSGILNQSEILFNMRAGMTMLKEFEVEAGSKMEVILVGCGI